MFQRQGGSNMNNSMSIVEKSWAGYGKHFLLIAAQLLLFVLIALASDVFSNPVFRNQFFGHVGPAIMLVLVGVLALNSEKITLGRFVLLGACAGAVASFLYVFIDTFIIHPPLGIFDGAGVAEQQPVGIILLIGFGSLLAILAHKKFNFIWWRPELLHTTMYSAPSGPAFGCSNSLPANL